MNYKTIIPITIILACVIGNFTLANEDIDSDNDGLTDYEETNKYFTDKNNKDTDGDGHNDGDEIKEGYSPRHGDGKRLIEVDSDKDYLNDAWELKIGTSLMNPDSDGDLYLDGTEVAASFNPLSTDKKDIKKLIKVSLEKQNLTYYFGDILLESFPISGGLYYTPTPIGDFHIIEKYPVKHYGGVDFDYPNTKWNLHFTTQKYNYYIHGAYWHNNFGKAMSHGCVNVHYDNMELLYWWSEVGTKVIVE